MNLENARIIDHARDQMTRRSIGDEHLALVLREPETIQPVRTGRVVAQRIVAFGDPPRDCLLRVFVDIDRDPS